MVRSDYDRTLRITWLDGKREAAWMADPRYPDGHDLDLSNGAAVTCNTGLAHPAPRCGLYRVECPRCGKLVMVMTTGGADDPRSLTIACWKRL